MDLIESFMHAMRDVGITPPAEIIADGEIHRFHVAGDKLNSANGWYLCHVDGIPAGRFGTWKDSELVYKWCTNDYQRMTAEWRTEFRSRMNAMKRRRDEATDQVYAQCRKASARLWNNAPLADHNHPYLTRKGVKAYGLRQYKDMLLIPVKDLDGMLHSVQFIYPEKQSDGKDKKFKYGTNKRGHFFKIGTSKDNTVIICEGYATGASIHEATGHAVVVAFDSGNLLPVALAIRSRFPEMKIIIAADDDGDIQKNPGISKGTEAAKAVGGLLAVPVLQGNKS